MDTVSWVPSGHQQERVLSYHPSGSWGGGEDGPAVSAGASCAIIQIPKRLKSESEMESVKRKNRAAAKTVEVPRTRRSCGAPADVQRGLAIALTKSFDTVN